MMKKLILVRHGVYDEHTGDLTEAGRSQIAALSKRLSPHLTGTVKMVTSTAQRAVESAAILDSVFRIGYAVDAVLLCDIPKQPEYDRAVRFIRSLQDEADTLTLVTHMYFALYLGVHYGEAELKKRLETGVNVEKGEAVVIDCVRKTILVVN